MSTEEVTLQQIYKELRSLSKLVRKVRAYQEDPTGEKASERAKNNGFNRLQEVTPELRKFLGLAKDECISRSDVTKRINAYIIEKGLKHPDNGKFIVLDNALKTLLNPKSDEQISYLNIQKYLSPHYIKGEPASSAPASAPASCDKEEKNVEEKPKLKKPVSVKK
ncbi:hypothetical protein [Dishui Lake phycodnavirus 4]|jgi:chromatin remodeling complex protein RSC6|nr:hypothetical protein [Dishui Lake phycodnavirus 4]